MWGNPVQLHPDPLYFKTIMKRKIKVSLGDAIFRDEKEFRPASLRDNILFWENEILKNHPDKDMLLTWLKGTPLEKKLNSFTVSSFHNIPINSYYPKSQHFDNYVPVEFNSFMDQTVEEWVRIGMLQEWEKIRTPDEPLIPEVISPLGVEPSKPRALWDGRFVNEHCRDIPFVMEPVSKIAELSWKGAYFFKIDHKQGYLHVPIERKSRKFFGIKWKGKYYVITVLPFGWKSSPLVYHSISEAVAMYLRSLGIPLVVWIDDMFGMTEAQFKNSSDETQFQSALRNMVVTSMVLFRAGYFCGMNKCSLIPEQVMQYLGIVCNSISARFFIPEDRADKYLRILEIMTCKKSVSYHELEKIVGKLVSLECAVPPGMWYVRSLYAALSKSKITPSHPSKIKQIVHIQLDNSMLEDLNTWIFFLKTNKGSPWKQYHNLFLQADIASDASGRSFAGIVSFQEEEPMITSAEFSEDILPLDIQIKEAEALKATIVMLVNKIPDQIQGKTLICKVDNQALKAIFDRKGTSRNLFMTQIGKQLYWLQYFGEFFIKMEYVKSELNVADTFTRQNPVLEASITHPFFMKIWNKFGPFKWDLMASSANVNCSASGEKLKYFSRYYDHFSHGCDIFLQPLHNLEQCFCFPPSPIIGKLMKYFQQQKANCVMVLPKICGSWYNLMKQYCEESFSLCQPFNQHAFTIVSSRGIRVPMRFKTEMIVVKLNFAKN